MPSFLKLTLLSLGTAVILQGQITSINDVPFSQTPPAEYCVAVFQPQVFSGQPQEIANADVYAMRGLVANTQSSNATGRFSVSISDSVPYVAVLAFQSPSCRLNLASFPAIGWFRNINETFGMQLVANSNIATTSFNIDLHAILPFPPTPQTCCGGAGKLTSMRSHYILRLKGTRKERGFAHGCLLYKYIVSHFRFFTLERNADSAQQYLSVVVPFVEKYYKIDPHYNEELSSLLTGMRNCSAAANDASALFIPELQREITLTDLYYINSYGTYAEWGEMKRKEQGHCSQFAFWGSETADGETIVARNMDGENDFRKATVANALIFSVSQDAAEEPSAHPFVYVVWPGFVTSASGLSTAGIHIMGNDGPSNPTGPLGFNATMDMWAQRQVLAYAKTMEDVPNIIAQYQASTGGTCLSGCNLFIAAPVAGNKFPALAYEGDRNKAVFRQADQAPPYGANHLMVTNHFLSYGFDPLQPMQNFGAPISLSSLWRYAAGQHRVEWWNRYGQTVGFNELVNMLQIVCHGTTEHSVITFPAKRMLSFAKSDMATGGWYAPFLEWTNFTLDELLSL